MGLEGIQGSQEAGLRRERILSVRDSQRKWPEMRGGVPCSYNSQEAGVAGLKIMSMLGEV